MKSLNFSILRFAPGSWPWGSLRIPFIFIFLFMLSVATKTSFAFEPSFQEVRTIVKEYLLKNASAGIMNVYDEVSGKNRRIRLIRTGDQVKKSAGTYYAAVYFKDIQNNDMVEIDFHVKSQNGKSRVEGVYIHKVNNRERFTYNENGHRVPIKK